MEWFYFGKQLLLFLFTFSIHKAVVCSRKTRVKLIGQYKGSGLCHFATERIESVRPQMSHREDGAFFQETFSHRFKRREKHPALHRDHAHAPTGLAHFDEPQNECREEVALTVLVVFFQIFLQGGVEVPCAEIRRIGDERIVAAPCPPHPGAVF